MVAIREIPLAEFLSDWGAYVQPNGALFTHTQIADKDRHHVWTITDDDDAYAGFIAIPGLHIDDRYGYCMTREPWSPEFRAAGSYAIWINSD